MVSKFLHLNEVGLSGVSFEPWESWDVLTVAEDDDGINLRESLPTCSRENQRPTDDCSRSLKPKDVISKISIETNMSNSMIIEWSPLFLVPQLVPPQGWLPQLVPSRQAPQPGRDLKEDSQRWDNAMPERPNTNGASVVSHLQGPSRAGSLQHGMVIGQNCGMFAAPKIRD